MKSHIVRSLILAALFLIPPIISGCGGTINPEPGLPERADTLVFIDDPRRYSIGDDEPHSVPQREETFVLSGRAISARVELNIYGVDYLGAEILVNGVLIRDLYPSGYSGPVKIEVPPNLLPLPIGVNKVKIRAKTRADGQMEDFEYDGLKVIAAIEAPVSCIRALAQKGGRIVAWIVWGIWFLVVFTAVFRGRYPTWVSKIWMKIRATLPSAAVSPIWRRAKRPLSYAILFGLPAALAGWIAYNHMSGTPPESYIRALEITLSRWIERGIYALVQC